MTTESEGLWQLQRESLAYLRAEFYSQAKLVKNKVFTRASINAYVAEGLLQRKVYKGKVFLLRKDVDAILKHEAGVARKSQKKLF